MIKSLFSQKNKHLYQSYFSIYTCIQNIILVHLVYKNKRSQHTFVHAVKMSSKHTKISSYIRGTEWLVQFSSVQSLSRVYLFLNPWTEECQASLSITNSQSFSNSRPSSWWCHQTISSSVVPFSCLQSSPALSSFLISQCFASGDQNIEASASNEYSRLISFWMDWLDLLAAQRTLKSLLQHHSSKASILWCSAFFIGQLSHPYMTTEKNYSFD